MIEINLLPGARKKSRSSRSASLNLGAIFAEVSARFKDPWLIVAVAGVAIGLAVSGGMFLLQGRSARTLAEQERIAVQDSARFADVLKQRTAAEARRDSILRQMAVISAIDGDRFVWPHVMDEVARAVPTYTWIRSLAQTAATAPVSPEAAAAGNAPPINIRLVAYTVDFQALTIFMRQLEASPFFENVTLAGSEAAVTEGKEVTQFELQMRYSKPPPSAIRTVPLSISVR
ncbi:MAG: PilN domain-containing protein [Gemmatimonadaceae bacterium]